MACVQQSATFVSTQYSFSRPAASIGASAYRHGVEDGAQLLREADHALYRAKRAGRNRWVMFAPEDAAGSETPPA